ncbi:MAG: VWA domain-containing protein [Desulfovibrionaceae bacterium]|nr:VWA domain-containing protein [Desulfovibrionaceae bacterium]
MINSLKLFICFFLTLAALSASGKCVVSSALAQDATGGSVAPLLMEGKKTLFQRVIVYPEARSFAAPGSGEGEPVKPFSVFYVYERKDAGGEGWVKVSPSTRGEKLFWVPAAGTAPWNQALTLLFSERVNRDPVLFFNSANSLEQAGASADVGAELKNLARQFKIYTEQGESPADFPVLAAEPEGDQGAVARSRFYIMPIFDWTDPFEGVKFLQVASIDPGNAEGASGSGGAAAEGGSAGEGEVADAEALKTGIAFVIDTTISMRPYIEQSLQVVRSIYDAAAKAGVNDKLGIAVVAFRSSLEASPGIEYDTKIVSQFKQVRERQELEKALSEVREANVSTHAFNEDSYGGLLAAIEKLDWSGYQSRVIMLISDAGPLEAGDQYATTRMGAEEVADLARAKGIKIVAVHVKTPGGKNNHNYAAGEYQRLTRLPDSGETSYVGINAASSDSGRRAFSAFAGSMGEVFVDLVRRTAENSKLTPPKARPKDDPAEQGRWIAENLGYSMQLEYLGEKNKVRAPQVVNSWIADMDLARLAENYNTPSVEVAVLLSKAQLNALQQQLRIIVDNAERTKKTDSKDFFQSILSASAQMSRDPGMFALKPGQNLQQLGVLGEFLDDLPYKSQVLSMTEEDWYNMPVGQQTAFINRLKSRIARYDEYEKDRDNWESFGAENSDDWLYRVPLNMLP